MKNDCVFCDADMFSPRLIGEDDYTNFIATLGQISNGGYTLIVPKRHVACIGELSEDKARLMDYHVERFQSLISRKYGLAPVVFEHGIVGQTIKHAHIHLVPAACDLTDRIVEDFPNCRGGLVASFAHLRVLYEEYKEPYLIWKNPAEAVYHIVWNPPAPAQYLRTILAVTMGCPERANWRGMDPELDRELWQETVMTLARELW